MEKGEISAYVSRVIGDCLKDRAILLGPEEVRHEMTAGVPQGSVLGPVLWNLAYNGVLEEELPEGVRSVAYADNLALIVTARDEDSLVRRADIALERVAIWMDAHHLKLAPEKTEAILKIGRKKCREIELNLRGHLITPQKEVKYLG